MLRPILLALTFCFVLISGAAQSQTTVSATAKGIAPPYAEELALRASQTFPAIAARLGSTSDVDISLTLVDEISGQSHSMPGLPPWAAGAARGATDEILLAIHTDGQQHNREQVLTHELTHLAVFHAAGGAPIPRWINEGIARNFAGEHGPQDHRRLAEAKIAKRFFPLKGLERSFPAPERDAQLAYAMSGRAVSELIALGGDQGLKRLLKELAAGASTDDALLATYGLSTFRLQNAVEDSVTFTGAIGAVAFDKDIVMSFGVLLILLSSGFFFRRRRQQRERFGAMEDAFDAAFALRYNNAMNDRLNDAGRGWATRPAPAPPAPETETDGSCNGTPCDCST